MWDGSHRAHFGLVHDLADFGIKLGALLVELGAKLPLDTLEVAFGHGDGRAVLLREDSNVSYAHAGDLDEIERSCRVRLGNLERKGFGEQSTALNIQINSAWPANRDADAACKAEADLKDATSAHIVAQHLKHQERI